jgi:hypothetical protein
MLNFTYDAINFNLKKEIMKKIQSLIAISVLIFTLGSCSKDDEFSMVGTWEQEKFDLVVSYGVQGLPNMVISDTDKVTMVFNADGTGTATSPEDGSDNFTWAVSGDDLTLTYGMMQMKVKLTTKTNTRVVGEQTLTATELALLAALLGDDGDDEDDIDFTEILTTFPNASVSIIITLVKK